MVSAPKYKSFNFLIDGGKATAGPPIGPALGPLGVNVMEIVKRINELTAEYAGMKVPVTVKIDLDTKSFSVEVGVPTVAALVLKELRVSKGSGTPGSAGKPIGDLKINQIIKIAKLKMNQMLAKNLKAAVKEVLGTCRSMGVSVDGKDPREVQKLIDSGFYDELLER